MTKLSYARASHDRPSVMRVGKNYMHDLIDGGAGYPGDYPGNIYFVNNVTGSSTNDGLSWNTAFDEVDAALLASEHFRHDHATNNKMIRNVIYVQGTEASYEVINQDFNGADLFGIGNHGLLGGAAGDVHIDGAGAAAGFSMTDLVSGWDTTIDCGGGLGCNIYNIHFTTTGAYWCADLETMIESSFEDCFFLGNGAEASGGLRITSIVAGCVFRNCHSGSDQAWADYGFYFGNAAGGTGNENLMEGCWGRATTAGFYNNLYLQGGSVWRNNIFDGGTYGIQDPSTGGTGGIYANNYCTGTTAGITVTTNPTSRAIGNWSLSNGTFNWYTSFLGTS